MLTYILTHTHTYIHTHTTQNKLKSIQHQRDDLRQKLAISREQFKEARKGAKLERGDELTNNPEVRRLLERGGTPNDVDLLVERIESEFETSVAGADSRFSVLADKPNISKTGVCVWVYVYVYIYVCVCVCLRRLWLGRTRDLVCLLTSQILARQVCVCVCVYVYVYICVCVCVCV